VAPRVWRKPLDLYRVTFSRHYDSPAPQFSINAGDFDEMNSMKGFCCANLSEELRMR
jgi:hypothetical protein